MFKVEKIWDIKNVQILNNIQMSKMFHKFELIKIKKCL
jgi:hypothetical protein